MSILGPKVKQIITPMLAVDDCAAAIAFYKRVFNAVEVGERYEDDGKIGHAELQIAGATVMIADEFPEHNQSPKTLGGTPVMLHLEILNIDSVTALAASNGATILREPSDGPGGRVSKLRDPYGHVWFLSEAG